jgi:hypothetical protein
VPGCGKPCNTLAGAEKKCPEAQLFYWMTRHICKHIGPDTIMHRIIQECSTCAVPTQIPAGGGGLGATVDRTCVLKAQPFANQPCIVNRSNHFHTYTESCNNMKQHVTGLIHTYHTWGRWWWWPGCHRRQDLGLECTALPALIPPAPPNLIRQAVCLSQFVAALSCHIPVRGLGGCCLSECTALAVLVAPLSA